MFRPNGQPVNSAELPQPTALPPEITLIVFATMGPGGCLTSAHQTTAFNVISNPTPDRLEEIFRLRLEAWRTQANLKPGNNQSSDAWDDKSHHRVLVDQHSRVVGAFRFSLHDALSDLPDGGVWLTEQHREPGPHAYFSRMFLAPEFQGCGLSEDLDELAISEPFRMGARTITCLAGSVSASLQRLPQMERRGWRRVGLAPSSSPDAFWVADRLPTILMISQADQ